MRLCLGCKNETPLDDRLVRDFDSGYCAECRAPCSRCDDWMKGEPEAIVVGKRVHFVCEAETILEILDDTLSATTDALCILRETA